LHRFNDTAVSFPRDKLIHQLFEEQAEKNSDRIALTCRDSRLTYRELNRKTNQLARLLQAKGTGPGTIVGILMERSVETLMAILAVLKAGGTYLPLNPAYPSQRIRSMVVNASTSILVTSREVTSEKSLDLRMLPSRMLLPLDELIREMSPLSEKYLDSTAGLENLIYIIFTSGSTGIPKGAGVYHRSFVNLVYWFFTNFGFHCGDNTLLLTSLSFDLTQKSLYTPLLTGGILSMPGLYHFDPGSILDEIQNDRVTWISCTPSMFYMLVEYEEKGGEGKLSSLGDVFLGGELISITRLIKWMESGACHAEIVNTYGPTECTDISASYRVREPHRFLETQVPIGKPIYNARLFILDKHLQLLPVGITGELAIGGAGVGIGYLNDEELTRRKFLKHSFANGVQELLYRTDDLAKWLPDGNIEHPVIDRDISLERASDNFRFSAAVAGFGMLLRDSKFKGDMTYKAFIDLAKNSKGKDTEGYRVEFIRLLETCVLLSK
jgi:amino acid adenylation domain-containing protein